jgi:hypothetical protein
MFATDFTDQSLTGTVSVSGGTGSFIKTLSLDGFREGRETFYVNLRTGSSNGPIVATSRLITVNDTSQQEIQGDLYPFTSFTFTNGGATGRFGPTSFASVSSYTSQPWYSTYFSVSSGIQYWTAPSTGNYVIRAAGAASHNSNSSGSYRGIIIESTIALTKGQQYKILVGQMGTVYASYFLYASGGGGGTFMTTATNTPIIVAGGAGGADSGNSSYASGSLGQSGTSGVSGDQGGFGGSNGSGGGGSFYSAGGGGFNGNGNDSSNGGAYGGGGASFVNGGAGGDSSPGAYGGFGGGGGCWGPNGYGGGGGGGYSGGGGGSYLPSIKNGGGGGSYSQASISIIAYNSGHGYLTITKI